MVYILKPTKVKETNKIILITFIWELRMLGDVSSQKKKNRMLGDAPKHVAVMCSCIFFLLLFFVFVCWH